MPIVIAEYVLLWLGLPLIFAYRTQMHVYFIYVLFALAISVVYFMMKRHRLNWQSIGWHPERTKQDAPAWLGLSLLMMLVILIIRWANGNQTLFSGFVSDPGMLWIVFPVYLIFGGPVQEWFYRGYLTTRLSGFFPVVWANLLQMFAFGILHWPFLVQANAPQMVILASLAGVAWTLLYHFRPNLIWASISHSLVGLVAFLFFQWL